MMTAVNVRSLRPSDLDAVEQAEAIAGIKLGLESMSRGEGRPAKAVLDRKSVV